LKLSSCREFIGNFVAKSPLGKKILKILHLGLAGIVFISYCPAPQMVLVDGFEEAIYFQLNLKKFLKKFLPKLRRCPTKNDPKR